MKLLIVALGIAFLIFLIVKVKLNTFISLIVTSFLVGLALNIPLDQIPEVITSGMGDQLGDLAIIFGMGSMIGKLVSDSGGGYRIANTLIDKFGKKQIQIAVIIASFIVGLALFFEVGLVVLLPIIFVIAKELEMPLLTLAIPMAATLNVMHGFIPPHPAPTAISGIMEADIGQVILFGLIVAIPTIIVSGPVFNYFLRKFYPKVYRIQEKIPGLGEVKEFELNQTPSFWLSVSTAMMPVILIGIATIWSGFLATGSLQQGVQFIGEPDVAMLLSLIFAMYTMGYKQKRSMKEISTTIEEAITQIAMMLFIIGGGGALKQVLVEGGISEYISSLFTNINLSPILAAWLVTAILRVSLGSSTVAAMTGAGLVAPLIAQTGVNPALMVLAVGAGSIFADHVNDAGFWMIKEYFGLSLKETFLTWTTLTSVLSVTGLVCVYGLSLIL
ncbi:gluconate:H+ symporter [Tetragenococcus koreensis]|uniref:Gluconate:proton symporter n=1 Tax=Tetragenococcus koreensis TaxID=290335 RepID=A0AAN4RKD0_9ENTE|nr:gluconate:H+ symporter [Tetragenococcus koreensis]AYW45691.1 gluconate permease [Tetragenococcus koreensis]MCF1584863.1 gluconate:H+ symporter [Tetragenococcus koreensis]MCF1614389.1 gluconate:H+ symporter [Tetragenococcus koreensis]MCF1616997.1 gluconate:H+ symporter [Tetragenococcus koreensis]MCF1621939.1 gluconate:H+ symporter [Tetragenococcus koreensis]